MSANPFNPGFVTGDDLLRAGFKSVGRDVSVFANCVIVGPENIVLGDHVRIDAFTTIVASGSGYLHVGSYVHIGGHCHLNAVEGIRIEDFVGLSQGVRLYSRSDDFSGEHLTGPLVPRDLTGGSRGAIKLGRHVLLGSGTVVLPGVEIGEGSSVGALSLVNRTLKPWSTWFGSPVKQIGHRSKRLLELEREVADGA